MNLGPKVLIMLAGYVLLAAVGSFFIIENLTRTGPNCPNRDPQWLGFCNEAMEDY